MQDSYRELFLSESQEFLSNIGNCLIKLEENSADSGAINEIFRCTHTLKGMSATMGYDKLAQLSHQMEDLLDEIRSQRMKLNAQIIDNLFICVDTLEQLLQDVRENKDSHIDISPCTDSLKKILCVKSSLQDENVPLEEVKAGMPFHPEAAAELNDVEKKAVLEAKNKLLNVFKINIGLVKDCVMKEARAYLVITSLKKMGEIIKSIPSLEDLKEGRFDLSFTIILTTKENQDEVQQELFTISEIEKVDVQGMQALEEAAKAVTDLAKDVVQSPKPLASYIKKIQSMRIPVERLDKIMNLMGELAIARIRLVQIIQSQKITPMEEVSFILGRLISSLQDQIMQTRLLPVAYVLDAFPRIIRDLARKENKEVDLEINGSEIELDRVVLDEISDPLIHLVRNAIDHGIESAEIRKVLKKNPRGSLLISVSRQKGQIFIEVSDDGKGVDFEAVRKTALTKGIISREEAANLDEKRILDLIASPGFSTATKVTDISGRGVGLDVVKSKIESLGGRLDFETKPKAGSKFILTLPLTLAIIKAMLVKVEEEIFAIPLMNIRETIKIKEEDLKILQNFEVIRVREEVVPTIRLNKEFGISPVSGKANSDRILSLVIIEHGKRTIGLIVSQVLGEQDIVVKPLGSFVKRTKGISGATILGDGTVALILDTMSLR